jgi:flagellar biosynthetic protein FlhB
MPEQDGDKSQEATQHRRDQAREQGQFARSQDLGSAAILVAGTSLLLAMGGATVDFLGGYTHRQLGGQAWLTADVEFISSEFIGTMSMLAWVLLPILGLVMLIAILTNIFQSGLLFLPDKLMPDIGRLDPLRGFGRIFSLANLVRLAFGIFKIILVGAVAYSSLSGRRDEILGLAALSLPQIAVYLTEVVLWTTLKIGIALLILALLDYLFQWWKNEQDMRMTTHEVREEMKNLQGNPQVISRRKQIQRQMVMQRLTTSVPKADVVVTNPTELAIAIQYDPETMRAPIVVAKGAGTLAQRIRQLALENGIPVVERKPLAQTLYKEVELNQPIPNQMYSGVAEVLAYVYQLKGKTMPKVPGM